jgi:hypothetical protein
MERPDNEEICGNCGRKKLESPREHNRCPSCFRKIPLDSKYCSHCKRHVSESEELLSSYEYGPIAAPLQDLETKVYKDRVVTEQTIHITGARSVSTVKRSVWRLGNVLALAILFASVIAIMAVLGDTNLGCSIFMALLFGAIAIYMLVVFLKLESDASRTKKY